MEQLIAQIKSIPQETNSLINQRLKEFQSFKSRPTEEWFQELCFCILAANSKQKTAQQIEQSLTHKKLLSMPTQNLAQYIKNSKHRFHNNKAKYITEARKHKDIKNILAKQENKRDWLVKKIKGLGYKEASHFLRNTGTTNLAILDRHIVNAMAESNLIQKPKTLTPKLYKEFEQTFNSIAKKLNTSPAKLDLQIWYLKTGKVAK